MSDHVIMSYALNGPHRGQPLSGPDISRLVAAEDLAWVHMDAAHPDTRIWIEENLPYLDRHALDGMLADETRPRATQIGDGMLVILRGVNLNEGAEPEDMVSIRVWLDPHRVISVRKRLLRAVQDIEARIKEGVGPDTAGGFLALLLERLTDRVEPVMRDLDDETDELEENVVVDPDSDLRRPITEVRRRTIHLRRFLAPQRTAAELIHASTVSWLDDESRRRVSEAQDKLTRTVEELDSIRDRATVVKDELSSALSERLNRHLYILSLISAVFLPLGFLTGLLGVNLGGIPGADRPYAFTVFTLTLLAVAAAILLILKKLRWL